MFMKRYVGYALIAVAVITLLVWGYHQFVQPILHPELDSVVMIFFIALIAVTGILAQFKDVVELFQRIFQSKDDYNQVKDGTISGPVHIVFGDVNNIVVNVTYLAQDDSFDMGDTNEKASKIVYDKGIPFQAPPLPPHFTGRSSELEAFKKILLSEKKTHTFGLVGLSGMGGIGKTVLASAIAHDPDVQERFFDGVLWGQAYDQGLRELLINWVYNLGHSELVDPETSNVEFLLHIFQNLTKNRNLLIVLDDVDQQSLSFISDISQVIGSNSMLLTTSRLVNLPGVDSLIALDVLPENESLRLFEASLDRQLTQGEREKAVEILSLLGHWPLAVRLAVGVLNSGKAITELFDMLHESLRSPKEIQIDSVRGRFTSIKSVLNSTYAKLTTLDQIRFRDLANVELFEDSFSVDDAVTAWQVDKLEAEKVLSLFSSLSLLNSSKGRFHVHPLIREYATQLKKSA